MEKKESIMFPSIMPSSISLSRFIDYQRNDFGSEEELQSLIANLFYHPEVKASYFCEHGEQWDSLLSEAVRQDEVLIEKTENFFFRHPQASGFINIEVRDDKYEFEWQREVAEAGPMYSRSTLVLSAHKRLSLETWQKIHMEDEYREMKLAKDFQYDVFLSYSSANSSEAGQISNAITNSGKKAFMAEKDIQPGHDFEEVIRMALKGSREVWLLVSPSSIKSEWVTTEWGAAWALEKKIVPILFRSDVSSLPDRLKRLHCVDFHCYNDLINSLSSNQK
ncbi:MAG: hypothetical protein DCF18_01220 [Cyanobium sp.]|nr:MAG: hypothetical protein DCF18_01220 [Cyanobium sp.]